MLQPFLGLDFFLVGTDTSCISGLFGTGGRPLKNDN